MDVIMAIKPKWCKKIISGEKTVEVRKSEPDFARFPFRVFVYATFGRKNWFHYGKQMSGHVIGEFQCKRILPYSMNTDSVEKLSQLSCVERRDLHNYAGKDSFLYGWEIKDFMLYEQPLPIECFANAKGDKLKRPPQSWQYAIKHETT